MLDELQSSVIENEKKKKQDTEKKKYNFDQLKMYFREDLEIKDGIMMSQPTIGDIVKVGERDFYTAIFPFLYNSTSIRLQLWDIGKDWNNIKDIEVFSYLMPAVSNKDPLKLFFKDINFDDFILQKIDFPSDAEGKEIITRFYLYSKSQNIYFDEDEYMFIAEYIRTLMNFHPKVERAKGKTAKNWIIQEDRMNLYQTQNENDYLTSHSTFLPLISSCINHPGFKYKLQELREVGIYQFMDSVKRIQKYETSTAALKGAYSGMIDTKNMDPDTFNFLGDI